MHKTIISDTSCLILLFNINSLVLLNKLYGTIVTTNEVVKEFELPLPPWFLILEPKDKKYQVLLEASIDKGEASAIALASEMDDCLLIMDDLKGRKVAEQIGLKIIGTVGVIVDAKLAGIIPSVKPLLAEIKKTNFRITEKLEKIILAKAGE